MKKRTLSLLLILVLLLTLVPLGAAADVGVYVPGDGALYASRGVSRARFGGYIDTSAANLNAFKNDRTPGMTVNADNFKMVWGRSIQVDMIIPPYFSTVLRMLPIP